MNNSKYKSSVIRQKTQEGSVLLWGLVILLTLTVIGVAAARMGITDIRIASNQIFSAMTYQGAESALERVSGVRADNKPLFYIEAVEATTDAVESWSFSENVTNGATNSTVTVRRAGSIQCAPQEGFAMSVEMTGGVGSLSCLMYTIDSRASLAGTGARSNHSLAVMPYAPGTDSVAAITQ